MYLCLNSLLSWHAEGEKPRIERVLYIDPLNNLIYTIHLHSLDALPILHTYSDITAALQNGDVTIVQEEFNERRLPPAPPTSDQSIREYKEWEARTKKALEHRDRNWRLIEPLIQSLHIYDPHKRGDLIEQRVLDTGTTKKTIYLQLRRYWQGGMFKNALLPFYANSGGKGKQREPKSDKLGRPNSQKATTGVSSGVNVDARIRILFYKGVQKYYNIPAKPTLRRAFEKITSEYFVKVKSDGTEGKVELLDPADRPTFEQFRYWYNKYGNPINAWSRRVRPVRYERMLHPPLQDVTTFAFGPGSCFEVDATIADVYLVSSLNPRRIVGRPVIYIVKDVFSRMVVGFTILLEGPSWLGAMLALENAATNKVAFCKEYGIDIEEEDWPCQHLCAKLRADRGEFEGYNADNLAEGLGIEVENTAPYRADWKSIIERDFGLCNELFIHFLPGSVLPRERGDKDYRLDACLTLRDLRQLMILRILQYNHNHRLEEYELAEDMIRDEVEPYPNELWQWGIQNRVGALRMLPQNVIRQNLLYRAEGSVTNKGIRFQGLRYTCSTAQKEFWFATAKRKGSWKAAIFFDPRCLDTIFIRHANGQMEQCILLERKKAFKRRDWYEVLDHGVSRQQSRYKRRREDDQARTSFDQEAERIKSNAQKRQQAIDNHSLKESDRRRIKAIRPSRQVEREFDRQNSLWYSVDLQHSAIDEASPLPPSAPSDSTSQSSSTTTFAESSAEYDFLRSIRDSKGASSNE